MTNIIDKKEKQFFMYNYISNKDKEYYNFVDNYSVKLKGNFMLIKNFQNMRSLIDFNYK